VIYYHILTSINICLMVLLAWRSTSKPATFWYFLIMATSAAFQNTRYWALSYEALLAIASLVWVTSQLPRGRRAIAEALAIGLLVAAILMLALPKPWPAYPPAMYYTRLYSTAACIGIATPLAVLDARKVLIIAWFAAVLVAGSQRGWNYVTVAVACNAAWTAILIAWNVMAYRTAARSVLPE